MSHWPSYELLTIQRRSCFSEAEYFGGSPLVHSHRGGSLNTLFVRKNRACKMGMKTSSPCCHEVLYFSKLNFVGRVFSRTEWTNSAVVYYCHQVQITNPKFYRHFGLNRTRHKTRGAIFSLRRPLFPPDQALCCHLLQVFAKANWLSISDCETRIRQDEAPCIISKIWDDDVFTTVSAFAVLLDHIFLSFSQSILEGNL